MTIFCAFSFAVVFFTTRFWTPLWYKNINTNVTSSKGLLEEIRSKSCKQLLLLALHCEQILWDKSLIMQGAYNVVAIYSKSSFTNYSHLQFLSCPVTAVHRVLWVFSESIVWLTFLSKSHVFLSQNNLLSPRLWCFWCFGKGRGKKLN